MRQRWLLNLGLALTVTLLALLAWRKPGLDDTPARPALTDRDAAAISQIHISKDGAESLQLVRTADAWHLAAPVELPALGYRVDSLLELLSTQQFAQFPLPDEASRAKYGLGAGEPEVTFDDLKIRFGDQNPVAIRRYVAIGDHGYLIDDRFHHHATSRWNDWADRRLLPDDAVLDALALPGFSLVSDDGKWRMTPDTGAGADALARFVDGWRYAYAVTIAAVDDAAVDDAAADAGPDTAIRIEWHREAPERTPETLEAVLARRDDEIALVLPAKGVEYRFTSETGARLLTQPRPEADDPPAGVDAADTTAEQTPDRDPDPETP